ncbi:MAG TPA: M1 family metallopeptidase [Flavobacteriales bacterium]|nr:M1 family metallopeptidase [Flavobacteriales bacterium]HQW85586.1 M1 family metallopeptidase [Flavobacteriales bacterium]
MSIILRSALLCAFVPFARPASAQCDRWQQWIEVDLSVDLDVRTHRFTGHERLVYHNQSPDTLTELWFHLYFNAFRPGSEMDARSRSIADPDPRVGTRIAALGPEEQGELRCTTGSQDGRPVQLEHMGTALRLRPAAPIPPGARSTFDLDFAGQVPVQIRRSGRNNAEGVAYSMTQWYPKVAAYDDRGWHAGPYVGREFYGEWGDHTLRITIDSAYTVAATGVLQDAAAIGHGYAVPDPARAGRTTRNTWVFRADSVHDVAWAADPEYVQLTAQVPGGPLIRCFFQDDPELRPVWEQLPGYMVRSFEFMNAHFGRYPWPEYSFVQGGDGGMEYPMLTLITGKRKLGSLVGVSVHESVHSWYYGVLASDEGHYAWMDEGFTEFASARVMQHLFGGDKDPHAGGYDGYRMLLSLPDNEPMTVHADHFLTNRAYGITAYSKGEMVLHQLGAVIGERTVEEGLRRLYDKCRFRHPRPVDVERSMEHVSGVELDWYFDEWLNTTRVLDLAVDSALADGAGTVVVLRRMGEMLMPVDLRVTARDGRTVHVHVPLSLMRGHKPAGSEAYAFSVAQPWSWPEHTHRVAVDLPFKDVLQVELLTAGRMADMDATNDNWAPATPPEEVPQKRKGKR